MASRAAELAGVSTPTIQKAINDGDLPSEKVGRHRRIPKAALQQWRTTLDPRRARYRKPTPDERETRRREVVSRHEQGDTHRQIAKRLGCSKHTVNADLDRSSVKRPGRGRFTRRLDHEQRELRRKRSAQLYESGRSLAEVAAENESAPTQVRRDLTRLGIEIRPQRREPKYEPPMERACEWCAERFTPPFPASDTRGGQPKPMRFHSDDCARRARVAARNTALAERGLLGTPEVAEQLRIGQRRVWSLIDDGELVAERVDYPMQLRPAWGVREKEAKRYIRRRSRDEGSRDGRRLFWLNPDQVIARERRTGELAVKARKRSLTLDEMEAIERTRITARAKQHARHRAGRKPGTGPPDHYWHWQTRYDALERELLEQWEEDKRAGHWEHDARATAAAKPTRMDTCAAVAEQDWREHRERWPRDGWPASPNDAESMCRDMRREAARRVLNGLKHLQNAVSVIQAA